MPRYSDLDAYVDFKTGVLKNLLGIQDQALLEASEADLVSIRSLELAISPIRGSFDLAHLRRIHWHLFRDVYAWAGELRTVDISKGDNRFAQRIKAIAAEHGVPVVENKPVARVLFAMGKVGEVIPPELYQAVAEILAVVYRTHRYYFHELKARRLEGTA